MAGLSLSPTQDQFTQDVTLNLGGKDVQVRKNSKGNKETTASFKKGLGFTSPTDITGPAGPTAQWVTRGYVFGTLILFFKKVNVYFKLFKAVDKWLWINDV